MGLSYGNICISECIAGVIIGAGQQCAERETGVIILMNMPTTGGEMGVKMETDFKKEARKQYLHYFRIWFMIIGAMTVLCIVLRIMNLMRHDAPAERVYDYADVLTDEEEENLRVHIARKEQQMRIHIVLVTMDLSVEGAEAREQYGYRYTDWERNMQDIADDFWDENHYGYNKGFEGDGVLLLHNWYPGQNGEHLSTSGKVERAFSDYDIDRVLYAVDAYYATDPCRAYMAYVDRVCELLENSSNVLIPWPVVLIVPLLAAGIYAVANLRQQKAENTTAVNAYVAGGKPDLKVKTDEFLRKKVTTRRIETQSRSSGGYRSSGGGGHHHSRSGASHGGGSHRH